MKITKNWSNIPVGFLLLKMKHQDGNECLHLHLKTNDDEWFNQPNVPHVLSGSFSEKTHSDFWKWAKENLPVFDTTN